MADSFKRWYDKNPATSKALSFMFELPDGMMVIVCDGIIHLVERDLKEKEDLRSYRSLGSEKVLALYKSKQRNRNYDKNPTVHKMVNYLYQLTDENRQFMAHHLLTLIRLVQTYLEACQKNDYPSQLDDVREVVSTYVFKNSTEAESMLESIIARLTLPQNSGESLEEVAKDLRLTDTNNH